MNARSTIVRKNARAFGSSVTTPLDEWACSHPYFERVFRWLYERVQYFSDPSLFLVVGPTGVGKTTMMIQLARAFARLMAQAMADNPSLLPSLTTEVQYIPGRGLDWSGLFTGLLTNANEILIEHKVDEDLGQPRGSLRALQRATNNLLLNRAPALVMIDEGGAFLSGERDSLLKSLRFLKSIGNQSKTHLAIFGDYKLAGLAQLDGQLNRRANLAHFPAYDAAEESLFTPVIGRFEERFRAAGVQCSLMDSRDFLFQRSCGCVGLLRKWVLEAYVESVLQRRPLDGSLLKKTNFSNSAVGAWRSEIRNGLEEIKNLGQPIFDASEGKTP